ncbi:Crp/Fnr family transcriptional regulator, partial [Halobacteriales archaeon SW_12_67_38]
MTPNADDAGEAAVLRSKRNATRYRILTGIAERQPA